MVHPHSQLGHFQDRRFQSCWMRLVTGTVTAALMGGLFSADPGLAEAISFDSLEDIEYWQNLCRLQADAENYEEALTACEQAIALSPENANTWAQHSGILLSLEAYPEAIASADRSLAFDDKNSLAIVYQCVAYTKLGETETALDKCNEALRVNGSWSSENPALAWLYRGNILAQAEQHELALVAYERTLLLEPEASLTLVRKCSSYLALARSHQAIDTCEAAIAGNGNWGDSSPAMAWTYQGQAYTQLGKFYEAIAAYDQAIALDPNNPLTWAAQGQVLEALRRDSEALVSYDRAVAIKADYSLAQLGKCTLLNRLGSHEEALASCDAALESDGDLVGQELAQVWNQRSIALTGAAQYEEALASINRAVGISPDYVEAH
ncbi:MAG: tetratricopeptide repeat protein, partial [Cyanobacteria bacterium P01_D01_bin.36]